MLRIDRGRLARADAEVTGVEHRGVVQETAVARVGPARAAGLRVVQSRDVPAAVARELRHHVASAGHHVPQVLRRAHPARVAAAHAHDGDRLVLAFLRRAQPLPQILHLGRGAPEIVQVFLFVGHRVAPTPSCSTAGRPTTAPFRNRMIRSPAPP